MAAAAVRAVRSARPGAVLPVYEAEDGSCPVIYNLVVWGTPQTPALDTSQRDVVLRASTV